MKRVPATSPFERFPQRASPRLRRRLRLGVRSGVRLGIALALVFGCAAATAESAEHIARLRDVISVEGIRENPLLGYGIVVGLHGTGDRQQTLFTTQTLANYLRQMGVQIPATTVRVNNVAAVFITSSLPPFARPGTRLDLTVSSIGDAKSLEGGLLLLTALYGADGQKYASAQGALALGGYSAGGAGNSKTVNHPTVARIPSGGLVEQALAPVLGQTDKLSLLLSEPSYAAAEGVAAAINHEFGRKVAQALDGRVVEVKAREAGASSIPSLMARIEDLMVEMHPRAKVVVNERTGTIVLGRDVKLGAVSILHGSLSIEIATEFKVSQPAPLSNGQTVPIAQPTLKTQESAARRIELKEGASVEDLVNGLQLSGATARDVIAILQAIKAAGAMQADLEVL